MSDIKYDVFEYENDELPVKFEGGQLTNIEGKLNSYRNCRAIKDGKVGYYTSNRLPAEEIIQRAARNAEFGKELNIDFPEPTTVEEVNVYSDEVANLPTSKMIDWGKEIVSGICNGIGKELPINVSIEKSAELRRVINSSGIDYSGSATGISAFIEATEAVEGDIHSLFDFVYNWDINGFDYTRMVDNIVNMYKIGEKTTSVKSGKIPILLHPLCVPQFLIPFISGINGENIKDGLSPLIGKIGEQIFSDKMTITDDPFMPGSPGNAAFDAEGIAAYKRPLIENGVLRSFNHTLETAAVVGDKPTGGTGRAGNGKPFPSAFNVVMEAGDAAFKDMLESVDNGLYLRYLSGGGQANALAGEFQMGIYSGYLIESGEISKRLKSVMIAGNIYEAFNQVTAISQEREMSIGAGGSLMPYVLLDDISVVGN